MRGRSMAPRLLREPRQHGHALGRNRGVGRDAIVGLAVPRRQMQRLDLGRGEGQRVDEGLRAHAVARDEDKRDGALLAGLASARVRSATTKAS